MELWNRFTALFGASGQDAEPIRLNASNETVLAESLKRLTPGQRGWISTKEARRLFSSMDENDSQALTEWDHEGLRRLGEFAADSSHRSTPLWQGGRVFFTRKAN
jgi:hypothetical protein